MSGNSSVGTAAVYEAGDQRNNSEEEKQAEQPDRYEEGKENAHQSSDSKDERSIANRLAAAHDQNDPTSGSGKKKSAEQIAGEQDPTAPALMHGNEPSRGAKIDKQIEDEEAEIIRKMDEKKASKN